MIKKNHMKGKDQQVFMQRSASGLYLWSPQPNDLTKQNDNNVQKPFFCDASAGSNGQDWITTFCYNLEVINYQQVKTAYTECGYAE